MGPIPHLPLTFAIKFIQFPCITSYLVITWISDPDHFFFLTSLAQVPNGRGKLYSGPVELMQWGEGSCIEALFRHWAGGALAFQVDPNLIKAIAVAWQIDNPRQIMQLKYYGYLSNWTTTLPQALHSCRAVSLTSWHGFEINVINQYELPTREVQVVQGFCINLMAKVTNRWGMDLCMIVH